MVWRGRGRGALLSHSSSSSSSSSNNNGSGWVRVVWTPPPWGLPRTLCVTSVLRMGRVTRVPLLQAPLGRHTVLRPSVVVVVVVPLPPPLFSRSMLQEERCQALSRVVRGCEGGARAVTAVYRRVHLDARVVVGSWAVMAAALLRPQLLLQLHGRGQREGVAVAAGPCTVAVRLRAPWMGTCTQRGVVALRRGQVVSRGVAAVACVGAQKTLCAP